MSEPDLWAEAVAARSRLEDAETSAERARSAYHELIRRLHTSGASLREIAVQAELSHQRVHQIVSGAACSFCERRAADVDRLVAGPGVFICNACTALGLHALAQGWGASDDRTRMEVRSEDDPRCCFCRKRSQKVGALATRGGMRICGHCLTLATREFDRWATPRLGGRKGMRRRRGGFDLMTPRAREALAQADSAARSLRHETVTPEHLLLGLLSVEDGLAARILTDLGATADAARRAVVVGAPEGALAVEGPMSIDPTTKQHIDMARKKATDLGHNYIGTEHLLLALAEESSPVRSILASLGVEAAELRPALMKLLEGEA